MLASTRFLAILSLFCAYFLPLCHFLESTDTITWGGNNDRTGYEENHNMDPAVVSSEQFGMLFRTALPGKTANGWPEQIRTVGLVKLPCVALSEPSDHEISGLKLLRHPC